MGEISRQLHYKLKAMSSGMALPTSSKGLKPFPGSPDIAKLIAEGMDPVHAAYVFVHHIASSFASNVSQLPEMRTFTEDYVKAEEQYLPSGPPMSPLTTSYFSCWAFFDQRIGNTTDTLASCLIDANEIIWMNPDQLVGLKKMNESRMGIYEHRGWHETFVRLQELITDDFLRRNMVDMKVSGETQALHRLMKFGPKQNYWNEFVLLAYHHHQADAIFLNGSPDLKATLPHA